MSIVKEFKEFISKGNVADMAVGVVIGSAFGKIVTSLVEDIIMPLISVAVGHIDVQNLQKTFSAGGSEVISLKYGNFLQNIINFLIISLCIFMVIKFINLFKKKEEEKSEEPEEPTDEAKLLTEIRDILKEKDV